MYIGGPRVGPGIVHAAAELIFQEFLVNVWLDSSVGWCIWLWSLVVQI